MSTCTLPWDINTITIPGSKYISTFQKVFLKMDILRTLKKTKKVDGITDSMDMGGLRELVMDREAWSAVVHGFAKSRTRLSD